MFTGIYQSLAIASAIIIFYISDFFLMSRYDRQRQASGSGRKWKATIQGMIITGLIIIQPILWPSLSLYTKKPIGLIIQIAGFMIFLSAFGIYLWARLHLRHFYAQRIEVQPNHQLIDTGPYAYVRHPLFSSYLTYALGFLLINPALITFFVVIYAFFNLSNTVSREEIVLSNELPGYTEYMSRTGRFFPNFVEFLRA